MCGLCGVFHGREVTPEGLHEHVRVMLDRLAHRGPDGHGYHDGPGFYFGHRRLSIIDRDRGTQPMLSPDGRYVLVFNGEIYNYLEIRQRLVQEGVVFQTFSDTEVLLQILIHRGAECLPELNGMFAFAFADCHTGTWLLARDPFGIKPLYYTSLPGELLFASEIKSLLAHPAIPAEVNRKALQHYLTFQFYLQSETLFEGIYTLEPGCCLIGRGPIAKEKVCYWDMDYRVDKHHTEAYFIDRLVYLLKDSSRLQIRSDVPVGAHLSGGIDSTVVASLAAEQLGGPLPLFHGRFAEGALYDESEYARAAAEWVGGEYHEVVPTAQDFVECVPRLVYCLDEPLAGPGLFPQFMVSRMASERVKVVLGGQGGDEVFGGYARYLIGYLEQAIKGAIFQSQEEGNHIVTLQSIIPNLTLLQKYGPLMQRFWKNGIFDDMDARYFALIDRSPDIEGLLTEDFRDCFDREAMLEDFRGVFNHPDTQSYLNKMTHFDQKTLLPALLQVEDRVSMAVSIESRVPLLDTRIVDMVTTMPPPMKFRGGRAKHIFKEAVGRLLPPKILDRKDKMGFPVPLSQWMAGGVVRDFVCDVLFSRASRQRGLFSPEALPMLVDERMPFGRQLWGALCLELWHQQYIDAQPVALRNAA